MDNYVIKNTNECLPDIENCIVLINEVKKLLFPNFFKCDLDEKNIKIIIREILKIELKYAYSLVNIDKIIDAFFDKMDEIIEYLKYDLEAAYNGDPAAFDKTEIVLTYPGYKAIVIYRIAHVLCELNVPYIPRILSEYAHSITGIDINPKATIGKYFFIDHL